MSTHDELIAILKRLNAIYNDFSIDTFDLVEIRKLLSDALAKAEEREE